MKSSFVVLPVCCLLLLGCSNEPSAKRGSNTTGSNDTAAGGKDSSPADPKANEPAEISLAVKSWDEVQQMVAGHKGKVVVVDIWSTWCVPCKREFPHLVALHRAKKEQVACISVSINYAATEGETPESHREEVEEFLKKQGATFENVISSDSDEDVMNKLQIASIPAVLLYDREGKLNKLFKNDQMEYGEEGFSYDEHIVPLIDKLLE